jgi:hypothetical protein
MLRWMVNFVEKSALRIIQNWAVGHIAVVELVLNNGDATNLPIMDNS